MLTDTKRFFICHFICSLKQLFLFHHCRHCHLLLFIQLFKYVMFCQSNENTHHIDGQFIHMMYEMVVHAGGSSKIMLILQTIEYLKYILF